MPYSVANPPAKIRNMPKPAQKIWIKAYNNAIIQYNGDEEIAHKVAYAAVKKAGYRKRGDEWVASARQSEARLLKEGLPASSYLVVGDPQKVTTWKLKYKNADGSLNPRLMGAAFAALTVGYRGQKVQLTRKQRASAKRKLKTAYKSLGKDMPRKIAASFNMDIDKDKIILESGSISQISESENQDDDFIVEGIALIGDQVSGNGIFYPLDVVRDAVARAQGSLPLNMQHQHPDIDNAGNASVLDTVGRLDALFMEGKVAKFRANIAPTQKGKDIRALIKGKYIGDISIRGYGDWTESIRQDAKRDITKLTLLGIDFVSEGSVEGAGITNIIRCSFSSESEIDEDGESLTTTVLEYIQDSLEEIAKNEKVKEELALRIAERDATIEELRSQINETKAEKAVLESKLRTIEKAKEIAELKESLISQREGISEDYKDVLRGIITGETEREIKEAIEINLKAYAYLLSQPRDNSVTGIPPQRQSVIVSQKGIGEEKKKSLPRPHIPWKNI